MSATITSGRREAFRFFLNHAGYATPPGRAVCALELVRAESLLREAELMGAASVEWVDDCEPWDEGTEISAEEASERFASGEWTGPFGCVVTCGDDQASLWGIVVGSRGTDDPYCRVVAAELASELTDALRQVIGDERDAAMFHPLSMLRAVTARNVAQGGAIYEVRAEN